MDIRTALSIVEASEPSAPNFLLELTGYKNNAEVQDFKDTMQGVDGTYKASEDRRAILQRFLDTLAAKGYTPISLGSFGAVFTVPGLDYVIKILKADHAYLSFVKFALENQHNPHVPKFRGKIMTLGTDHYAVRIERLTPMPVNDFRKYFCEALEWQVKERHASTMDEFLDDIDFLYGNKPLVCRMVKSFAKENAGVFETLNQLAAHNSGNYEFDIHTKNFMMRGKTMVIIDPYMDEKAVFSDLELARMRGEI